jgi:L-lactate dehydrogenase complex protein LldE
MSKNGDEVNAAAAEHLFVENFAAYDYIAGRAVSCVKQVRCHFDTIDQTSNIKQVRQHTYEFFEILHSATFANLSKHLFAALLRPWPL